MRERERTGERKRERERGGGGGGSERRHGDPHKDRAESVLKEHI